jgi:hypothetical protein
MLGRYRRSTGVEIEEMEVRGRREEWTSVVKGVKVL